jgi:pimeloyl-ACP methyl ester carboxylesterase
VSIIKVNGISLHVEQLDPDPCVDGGSTNSSEPVETVLLIHGLAIDNMASWYFTVANTFLSAGLRVVMYDLRGHGRSERPPTGYRLDDHVDDIVALLSELGIVRPVYAIGSSFGGLIAFSYALRHPDRVAGIATVESGPPTQQWADRMTAAFFSTRQPPRMVREVRRFGAETTLRKDLLASRMGSREEFAALDMPVLCLFGGDSGLAELADEIQQTFRRSRVVIIPGQRHALLRARSKEVGRVILTWLREDCGFARSPFEEGGDTE